jgi:hypothetical protein
MSILSGVGPSALLAIMLGQLRSQVTVGKITELIEDPR